MGDRLTNAEVDDLIQAEYEEALAAGESWAEQIHAHRARPDILGAFDLLRTHAEHCGCTVEDCPSCAQERLAVEVLGLRGGGE